MGNDALRFATPIYYSGSCDPEPASHLLPRVFLTLTSLALNLYQPLAYIIDLWI
jgi:hypothetical protein